MAGGDYKGALPKVMEWGASGFATVVSDALGEMGYDSTKIVWGVAVSETAKEVMQALARGDHDAAWDTLKERARDEVKSQGRAAAKNVINWVIDVSGDQPSMLGKTPGDLYLDLLDAEIAAIEWSKTYIREKSEISDGACIQIYEGSYASLGQDGAYDKFHECLATSRYSIFFEFGNQARGIGLDETAAIKSFLEARRKRETTAWTPLAWIAERVAERQAEIEKALLPELSRAETVMANLAEAAGRAVDNRLTELAAAKLNAREWDQLEAKVRELERLLESTLASVKTDLDRIRKNSDGVAEACTSYDTQKQTALEALNQGRQVSVECSRLFDRLTALDTSVCRSEEPSPAQSAGAQVARDAIAALASESGLLDAELLQVCRAVDNIKGSSQREEARVHLDRALAVGRDVQARAAQVKIKAEELVGLDPGASSAGAADAHTERRGEIMATLSAAKSEIEALAGRYAQLVDRKFKPAHQAMATARRRIAGLVPVTSDMIDRTKACLAPLAEAPIADERRRLLAELAQRSTNDEVCLHNVNESWLERDLDPGLGGNLPSSTPWERRELTLTVPIDRLRAKVAEIEALCSRASTRVEAPTREPDMNRIAVSTAQRAEQSLARANECVAAALVAYANIGKQPVTTPKSAVPKADQPTGDASGLPPMEQGTDRMGSDYKNFNLAEAQPLLCQKACHAERGCRAWTYVKPGIQGPTARCWLKSAVPPAKASACCVSGVNLGAGTAGSTPAAARPVNRQYFVYFRSDEFTCCKDEKGEAPHPLHVGEVREWTAAHRKLAGPFASADAAKEWACGHEIYRAQAWISNWARVGGVLVSNLPCKANR